MHFDPLVIIIMQELEIHVSSTFLIYYHSVSVATSSLLQIMLIGGQEIKTGDTYSKINTS